MNILLLDIETTPKLSWVWKVWKENIPNQNIVKDWYILCWAAKWLGETKVYTDAIYKHKEYELDSEDDETIVGSLWDLLDQADFVVCHNIGFDIPSINTRFLVHGIEPPSSYRTYDTLKAARSLFRFTHNSLGALGEALDCGKKLETGGMQLWLDVLDDNKQAWKKMVDYCKQDVLLLEKVYNKIRPYDPKHPNIQIVHKDIEERPVCCQCGGEVTKKGFYYTNTQVYQRYKCGTCGHNQRGRYTISTLQQRKNTLRSV